MQVVLATDRLVLRRFTEADVDHLVELDSDPEVTRCLTRLRPVREEVARKLAGRIASYDEHPGFGLFAAIERATGDFIGWFHLRPGLTDPRDDEPELGYRLRRAAWGRGYATEGSRALIEKAFAELGASRVWAETMAVNAASRRVMEKAGLRFAGTVHNVWPEALPGGEHGDVQYAITRAEWEADRRPAGTTRYSIANQARTWRVTVRSPAATSVGASSAIAPAAIIRIRGIGGPCDGSSSTRASAPNVTPPAVASASALARAAAMATPSASCSAADGSAADICAPCTSLAPAPTRPSSTSPSRSRSRTLAVICRVTRYPVRRCPLR
jgi:RimJ/RimL family protein N-acetyltransferase